MSELEPCPFCGEDVMFRKALFPSDGNVDAIIHHSPTNCGMGVFSTDTTDESVIDDWNNQYCLSTAKEEGRAEERRLVVEFLRGQSSSGYTDPQYDLGVNLADAIERLEHLPLSRERG